MKILSLLSHISAAIIAVSSLSISASALVNVQTCIISPWAPFQLHGDFATYAYPDYAHQYWPDLNVSHMRVIGDYNDVSNYDVVRSYMAGNGGIDCNLVVGPGYSDGCIAISPLIGQPLWIDFASTSTQLSSKTQFPNFLRVVSTDAQGGAIVASLLKTYNWKNVFVIKSDDSYGSTYASGVATSHTKNGGQILRTFNLLEDTWTVELFKSTLLQIRAQKDQSRVVVVIGILVSMFAEAVQDLNMDTEFTFIFSDYACSANSPWSLIRNAFCITVDLDESRWANFTEKYTSRSDAEFNRSAEELYLANYPEDDVIPQRNEVESFTALSVDAVFYGLMVLQHYQAANGGALPTDSVEAATYAMASNLSFPKGMTGVVGVDSNGDRATFISAIYNSGTNYTSQVVARDLGDGQPIVFTLPVTILGQTYDLSSLTSAQIAYIVPADRIIFGKADDNSLPAYALVLIAIVAAIAAALLIVGVNSLFHYLRRGEVTKYAPKSEAEPAAIIFTDIESSTAIWAECPQKMVVALELHNTIIRKCISEHKGYEVKTIGDSFMIAFSSAVDAVNFSLAMQTALHSADWSDNNDGAQTGQINNFYDEQHINDAKESPASVWNGLRVRVGGHAGFLSVRRVVSMGADGSSGSIDVGTPYDYFGSTVNVAARIEAIGHGGQVLVSKALLELFDSESMSTSSITFQRKPMGNVDLRGYNEPVQIMQLFTSEFERRVFNALRIEKADLNDFEQSATHDDTQSQAPTGTLSASNASADMHGVIQTFSAKRKVKEEDVKQGFIALDSLTSVMAPSEQRKILSTMVKAWHIKDDTEGKSKNSPLWLKLLLASRLGPVMNVREHKLFGTNPTGTKIGRTKSLRSQSNDGSDSIVE